MVLELEVQEREIYFECRVSLLSCLLNSFRSILSFKTNISYLYIHWPQTYQIQYVVIRDSSLLDCHAHKQLFSTNTPSFFNTQTR